MDAIVGGLVEQQQAERPAQTYGGKYVPTKKTNARSPARSEDSDQHQKILQSYTEIPRTSWSTIPVKTYIRYMTNSKELKTGARLKSLEKEANGSYTLTLRKLSRGKKTLVWSINTKKVAHIYKLKDEKKFPKKVKTNPTAVGNVNFNCNTEQSAPRMRSVAHDAPQNALSQLGDKLLFDDMSTVTNRLDMVETRCQRIEQDLKRLFLLVKKMNAKMLKR